MPASQAGHAGSTPVARSKIPFSHFVSAERNFLAVSANSQNVQNCPIQIAASLFYLRILVRHPLQSLVRHEKSRKRLKAQENFVRLFDFLRSVSSDEIQVP